MLTVFTNADAVAASLMADAENLQPRMEDLMASVMFEFDGELKNKTRKITPIKSGNARKSWHFDLTDMVQDEIRVENYNTAPYIRKLEHGSSTQAPTGMTIQVISRAEEIIKRAAKNAGFD